ncbi:hypothetical protein Htur_1428 [Haloterrigena turkmenica DSM 5511]|uniref:DUF2092 domain-containing protein n=1 Tax=Haloterrigena turkmenica (strain ATCC 51198 / DSM 5511 / JCM 9101 / NCIMB 13204 / VKM B-1734 / 4k) TaxID=543526 RepID=D2RQ57_HALTV|nr:hypothetical protein [Haloterrigena turkmenica]ADB60316.1 hypothetical protein Htur_1428 [Haloterrigena turkmenica DSM 5511]
MNRRRFLTTGVGAGVALAGCVSYPSADDGPSSEALLRDAIETRRGLHDLRGRRTLTVETPSETVERTERVVRQPPAKQRLEVLESTDPDAPVGSVTVTNREMTWEYNPEEELVDLQFHGTKVDADRTLRVLEALLEDYRLGYEGTTTIDGRDAHVIETRPPVEETGRRLNLVVGDTTYAIPLSTDDLEDLEVSRTIAIDDEYRYPVRERNEVRDDGEIRYQLTVTYEDLAIDEGVESETFTYQPPADATVVTDGTKPEGIFDSIDEAESAVPYDLPEAVLPDAYLLDRITVVERDEEYGGVTTTLWYNDPNVVARELFIVVREQARFDPDVLEEIEIDGRTAYYRDGRIQSVFWDCDNLSYEVSSLVDGEPIREITASIGCP